MYFKFTIENSEEHTRLLGYFLYVLEIDIFYVVQICFQRS